MNVTEAIYARRAVRAYTPRVVDTDTVRTLLRAAVQAPSAMNAQPWVFAVVQDRAQLQRWSERAKALLLERGAHDAKARRYEDMLRNPGFNVFYDASTLVVIGVEERGRYSDADCWLAAENLMLAACDAGLGSCPIGFALPLLETPEIKTEIGLAPTGAAIAAIILGYPSVVPPAIERREPEVLSWTR
jgi:nitroreductase